jgi:hypothetical protein
MPGKILQVNFKYNITKAEYEQAATSLADKFATVDGLVWKVWIMNEADSEAGGIYFFKDGPSLKAYLDGELAASVKSHPAFSDMSAKVFDVMDDATAITRGPVK